MTCVEELISAKKQVVHTVLAETPVLDAIAKMVAEDVGSLVVVRDDAPCGMLTERDYLRRVVLKTRPASSIVVGEIMSPDLIFVRPQTDLVVCMALMTRLHMRHLPVLEKTALVGLISIGDIVKHLAQQSEIKVEELTHYIQGR
jgi:CBS domain-containing protein